MASAVATQEALRYELTRPRFLMLLGPVLLSISALLRVLDHNPRTSVTLNWVLLILPLGLLALNIGTRVRIPARRARAERAEQLNSGLL